MKSYGRAPTFLMITGYEQVRSVVAALAGDWAAARDTRLVLPETGVCHGPGIADEPTDSPCRPRPCRLLRLMSTRVDATPATSRFPYPLVCALGFGQIVAWGSFYYVFVSLTDPMAAEFGWTKTQISGALSVVLAVTGLCSYARGRWVDRYGGRRMMTVAAFAGAALLFAWAHVSELWQLYAISVGIGVVSAMTLYDAAFAVVARMFGADYRKAIIVITLFGGLASTVFVPLTTFLVDTHGWRDALKILAVIQLPFVAGIPYLLLRDRETLDARHKRRPRPPRLGRRSVRRSCTRCSGCSCSASSASRSCSRRWSSTSSRCSARAATPQARRSPPTPASGPPSSRAGSRS